eukprot:CAMPEP_0114110160 /NCGR_PEP_ID=MMETSP0043_2-20121206/1164_1 /TAXON_ID=464988 /ORGANISM="Hemiselmis andersenii, Strain CCMP644" /LENGTH=150 /DNA_ID=CAMNT_0001202091 /DNA_START=9 /DNA_END=457 /DNA_ORIENTATION=-
MPPTKFNITVSGAPKKKGGLIVSAMAGALGVRKAGGGGLALGKKGDLRSRLGRGGGAGAGDLRATLGGGKGGGGGAQVQVKSRLASRLGGAAGGGASQQAAKNVPGKWGHDMFYTSGQADGVPPEEDASMYPESEEEDPYSYSGGGAGGR